MIGHKHVFILYAKLIYVFFFFYSFFLSCIHSHPTQFCSLSFSFLTSTSIYVMLHVYSENALHITFSFIPSHIFHLVSFPVYFLSCSLSHFPPLRWHLSLFFSITITDRPLGTRFHLIINIPSYTN